MHKFIFHRAELSRTQDWVSKSWFITLWGWSIPSVLHLQGERNVSHLQWFFWVHAIDLYSCCHPTPQGIIRWTPAFPFVGWGHPALDGLEPVIAVAGWFPIKDLLGFTRYWGIGGACVLCVYVRVHERGFNKIWEFLRQWANDLQTPGVNSISALVRHSCSLFSHRLLYSLPSDPQNFFCFALVQFILLHWKWDYKQFS